MVRDVFHISGFVRWDACGHLVEIVLNQDALLARRLLFSLRQLLAPMHVAINLGQSIMSQSNVKADENTYTSCISILFGRFFGGT